MPPGDTDRARSRALRTAQVVTLGLALAAGATGCEAVTDAYCGVFSQSAMCCNRTPGMVWNSTTSTCDSTARGMPVIGPMVPPVS